jgi:hypothetical protein
MNGEYSTTPETMATSSSRPMKPRKSLPGRPANRSTCSLNMTYMKPSSNLGCARIWPVRASTATDLKSSVGAGVGVSVTNHRPSSSSGCEANCTTRSGCCALAMSSTRSRLMRGVPAGILGASTSVPSRWPISWWKMSGRPVRHSSSMNTVHTRLLHLCTQAQVLIFALFMSWWLFSRGGVLEVGPGGGGLEAGSAAPTRQAAPAAMQLCATLPASGFSADSPHNQEPFSF